jgi:hypothetical protein
MKGKKYREYLQSEAWRQKREAAKASADYRCQLCNAPPPLHVHHRTYERVGRELPGDLTVLCAGCHYRFHHPPKPKAGRSDRRQEIDQQIEAIVTAAGPITWRAVQRQIQAPRAQAWSRAQRLIKGGTLAWQHGRLVATRRSTNRTSQRAVVSPKDAARERVRETFALLARGEVHRTADIAERAGVSVSRTGGFLSGMARRHEGIKQLGAGRWRHG